jgi:two-component system cell cycle response regulator
MSDEEDVTEIRSIGLPQNTAPSQGRAFLIMLRGPARGEMFEVSGTQAVIGRDPQVEVPLADAGVSRRHARIMRQGGEILLEDLGSRNGTYCNGAPVSGSRPLDDGDILDFGADAVTMLKLARSDLEAAVFRHRMLRIGERDPLTGTPPIEYLKDRLRGEFHFTRRHDTPLTVMVVDVDRLATINRLFGLPAGDSLLRQIAQALQVVLRPENALARHRGDEFYLICRGADRADAANMAEQLRAMVETKAFPFEHRSILVTISIGVAVGPDARAATPEALLDLASEALRIAKARGRNQVAFAPSASPSPPTRPS